MKMNKRPNVSAPDHGYEVWIPESTPNGQSVTVETRETAGVHIMHAESPDQSVLYFEVTAYPSMREHYQLAGEQQAFLREHSADGSLTDITQGTVGNFSGTTFDFRGTLQGKWKERRFLFIDSATRTFRVVHDPTSKLNSEILYSLALQ